METTRAYTVVAGSEIRCTCRYIVLNIFVVAMSCRMFHGVWPRDGRISSHYYTLLLVSPTVTSV